MSVVGFDLGNENGVVAVARQRGIDVILNDDARRETPMMVCFGEKQRYLGTAGADSRMMHPNDTISQIKRIIGRQFSDPELRRDLKALPFLVTEGPDGYPLIHVRYLGEAKTFTPTQILGMVLSNLKSIAEKNLKAAVVDCCIGIPVYFTDLQRRAVMDAATIAGLNPLRLFHETTATALAYGIKMDLPETEPLNVAFVDIGHASMQVCIAAFKKGQLKILAHSFDRSLGGRDFDEVLFQRFAAKFKEDYKIDVFQNARASLRLRAACEKVKKVLSSSPEVSFHVECLMDEKDLVGGFITRDEFERISKPILGRVKKPLEKSLAEAGLSAENIHSVEVVGSGSQVPAIIKILTEFFGKAPRRTMNASECVAKGCALQCAILSPTFQVRDFQVKEGFPFPVVLSWDDTSSDNQRSLVVFPKGNRMPSVKAVIFYRSASFGVDFQYANASDLNAPATFSTYTIGPFQSTTGERVKFKLKVRLTLHGTVSVECAVVEAPNISRVPVADLVYGGLTAEDLQKLVEEESEMARQERITKETKRKEDADAANAYAKRKKPATATLRLLEEQLWDSQAALLQEQEKSALATKEAEKAKEAWSCKVCLSDEVGIALVPCGHLLCRLCSSEVVVETCPFCRCYVTTPMRIYRP